MMAGKIVLVTGSTDGIGLHTATRLAEAGATVLIHGRSMEKAANAAARVMEVTGSKSVRPYSADLASLEAVRSLASDVSRDHDHIDVLINNAGVFASKHREVTVDGFELTFAVNVLAPFLLTSLLLDKVTERIINVSSISAGGSIPWGNLNLEEGYSNHKAYSLSKLAVMLFTAELAHRTGSGLPTVNTLDPGTVNTKMLYAGWGACGIDIKDADDEFFLATSPSVASMTGAYYVGSRLHGINSLAKDTDARQRLWDIMTLDTGAKYS